jgi:pimeloyl-ACP methyl ester carboxylesterase
VEAAMPHAEVNGIRMYYERHGDDGEPLVLVHGYTGDVGDWLCQIPEFSRTHRVLVMDHRGHGRSEAPKDRSTYTIPAMADDIEALVAHVGFDRYHLLGHSMGGGVAQEIALRSPGRLLSLTLHDTGPAFGLGANPAIAKYFADRLQLADQKGMAALNDLPGMPDPPHMPPGRRDYEKKRMAGMSIDGSAGAWGALNSWPGTRERAKDIASPTLVIYGALDAGLVKGMEFLAATIPGAESVCIPEAAHCPQFERPEQFNAALRRHLERSAAAAPPK